VARLYPQLWIRVWAAADGVHLTATLIPEDGGRQTSNRQLIRAVWQPDEVTEQLVVEWAYRALRKLLQDEYEGTGHL
jgi:DNA-binding response OmpR family regulator